MDDYVTLQNCILLSCLIISGENWLASEWVDMSIVLALAYWHHTMTYITPGTLMTSAATDVINQNRSIQTYTILLCKDDVGSIVEPTSSLVWADVILANFQRVITRYLQNISTYLSCTTQRVLRTISMQKSRPKYACLSSKIVEVWIDRICVRYDWWRRLQLTSSVSPVWYIWLNICLS